MHIYWKKIYMWAKVTQVSDVTHGPLVLVLKKMSLIDCYFKGA
jgi:hypothetical protein